MSIVLFLKTDKKKRILRGADHFWSVVMERHRAEKTFSIRDIDNGSNSGSGAIRDFVARLEKAGLIELVQPASMVADNEYRPLVVQSTAPRVRRDGTVIESAPATRCMWNLMRGPMGRGGFTYRDLVHWAQTDETTIAPGTAKSYIKQLSTAGYLLQLDAGRPGTPATWRLDPGMNSGPHAPMILRTKVVFDPNRQEVFGPAQAEEVSP
ncbi:MAG: hypothetical protein DI537_20715 [Stutzerimonas stutzeri]|nr:MAG: hypothetical protein DI537_20715 [Stutzerimonas stutzeri]